MIIGVDKAEDKYMIDQSGKVWKISDGYRLAGVKAGEIVEVKAREVVEVPEDGNLMIEFEKLGVVRW